MLMQIGDICRPAEDIKRNENKLRTAPELIETNNGITYGLINNNHPDEKNNYQYITEKTVRYCENQDLEELFGSFNPAQRYLFEVYADINGRIRTVYSLCLICGKCFHLNFRLHFFVIFRNFSIYYHGAVAGVGAKLKFY